MADLRFDVSADVRQATQALGSLAQDIQNRLVNAVRALPNIELTADSTDAQKEMKRLRDEMAALANQRVGVDIDAGDALAEMQRIQNELRDLGGSTTEVGVRADVSAAERALGDIEADVRRLSGEDVEVEVTADTGEAEEAIEGFGDTAKATAAAAGAAVAAALVSGIAANLEMGQVQATLSAQLGLTAEESERVGAVAGRLYVNAYGESLSEVGDAVAVVIQNIDGISTATDDELQSVTGQMISLAQVMELDVGEAAIAVGQMIRTGLAGNAEEAMDILVAATQRGANKYGDLADTISGSSATLAQFGLDGKTSIGAITQAMDAGAPSADFFIGALEELAGNAGDSVEVFQSLGLNGEEMGRKLTGGGADARDALIQLMDALRNMDDPAARSTALVGLFGEEATAAQEALLAIDPSTAVAALGDVAGSAAEADATLGDLAQNKITTLTRGFEQWTASMVATDGPIGDVAAGVAAFGPAALGAIAAIAPLIIALRMGGIATAIGGVSAAAAGTGVAAGAAVGGASRLVGALKFAGIAGVIGGVALAIDDVNVAAANGADSLDGWSADLHELTSILRGDFTSLQDPFGDFSSEWDQLVRDFETGTSTMGSLWAGFAREAQGHYLPDIELDVVADPAGAYTAVEGLLSDVNDWSAQITINGNPNPAGFALRRILDEIAAGAETIDINGNPVPAEEALAYAIGIINAGAGDVTINGETMPAGEALQMFLDQANGAQPIVEIDGDPTLVNGELFQAVEFANGSTGTVKLDGDPTMVDGQIVQAVSFADGSTGTIALDANPDPATGLINGTVDYGNGQVSQITLDANNRPAWLRTDEVAAHGNQTTSRITVTANDGPARSVISTLKSWASSAVSFFVGAFGGGSGGGLVFSGGGMVGPGPLYMARGGVISGYQPGRDTVPAMLSRGEAVLVPELVREIGPANILAANKAASGRQPTFWGGGGGVARFAAGGMVDRVAAAVGNAGPIAAAAGAIPVVDVALRAEVRAVQGQLEALLQYEQQQIGALQALPGALAKSSARAAVIAESRAGLAASVQGAW